MNQQVCSRILKISQLKRRPSDVEIGQLDSAICAALVIVFLLVFLRYARWAWRARGTNGCALNCALAAASFYLLLALPALWVRSTVAWRTHATIDANKRTCDNRSNANKTAGLCKAECLALDRAKVRLDSDHPPHPIAVQVLGASLAGAFVLLTTILSLLCRFGLLSTPQAEHRQHPEIPVVSPRRKTDRFVLKILESPTDLNDSNQDDCCVVCLGELWDARVCELLCGHRFHARCISKWLMKSQRPICPLCQCDVRRSEQSDIP